MCRKDKKMGAQQIFSGNEFLHHDTMSNKNLSEQTLELINKVFNLLIFIKVTLYKNSQ